jgi:hypothetical protein
MSPDQSLSADTARRTRHSRDAAFAWCVVAILAASLPAIAEGAEVTQPVPPREVEVVNEEPIAFDIAPPEQPPEGSASPEVAELDPKQEESDEEDATPAEGVVSEPAEALETTTGDKQKPKPASSKPPNLVPVPGPTQLVKPIKGGTAPVIGPPRLAVVPPISPPKPLPAKPPKKPPGPNGGKLPGFP